MGEEVDRTVEGKIQNPKEKMTYDTEGVKQGWQSLG